MANKLINVFIIFAFLISVVFFCVQSQVNEYNQSRPSSSEYSTGTGDISTEI